MTQYKLPNNWKTKKLEDLLDYIQPTKYIVKSTDYHNNHKTPVLTAGKTFILGKTDETEGIFENLPVIIFDDFTTANKLVNFKFKVKSSAMKILKPKDENVNLLFVFYFIQTIRISFDTHKRYWISVFSKLPIALPSPETQTLIVSKIEELFSELDKSIDDLKTAQQQLKTYRQSVLKYAFEGKLTNKKVRDGELPKGWEIMNIGKICKCIVPNRDKPKSFNGDIKWVTTPNLKSNSIKLEYENISQGLSQSEVEEYNARVIPIGGVIMTCVGNFGLAAIVEKPIVINQQLHAFISNDLIAPKFIAYNIQYNKYFFEKKSTSTTIQYINKENCNSMPIPLCSVEEQHRIVQEIESRLSVADKMEESIDQSLLQAEALRQSILKKAFSGELV